MCRGLVLGWFDMIAVVNFYNSFSVGYLVKLIHSAVAVLGEYPIGTCRSDTSSTPVYAARPIFSPIGRYSRNAVDTRKGAGDCYIDTFSST